MVENRRAIPSVPEKSEYSISALYLTQLYTRNSYEAQFGEQPPPFDPQKPVKAWFLTDVTGPVEVFPVVNPETAKIEDLVLTREQAASVNLPGSYRYAPWAPVEQTVAVLNNGQPISGASLVSLADAQWLANEIRQQTGIQATAVVQQPDPSSPSQIAYGTETRRRISIHVLGRPQPFDAALLMVTRHSAGYKRPGAWMLDGANLSWTPSATPAIQGGHTEVQVPLRPLLPNEKVVMTPFSGILVKRQEAGGEEGGSFTTADRAKLDEIVALLMDIKRGFGL